ncbi:hypothetical protein ACWDX6_24160 [Streptomyces sp. NPDC003027]
MPGYDAFEQKVPYPKLSDTPNIETAISALVNETVPLSNMVFDNANARATVVTQPVEGMETFLIAEGRKEIFYGGVWNVVSIVPTWATYTPTWTGLSNNTNGVSSGRVFKLGKCWEVTAVLTAGASASLGTGAINLSLPAPAANISAQGTGWQGVGVFKPNNGTAWAPLVAIVEKGASTAQIFALRTNDNELINPGIVPLTWVAGSAMRVQFTYEVA